MKLLYKNNKNGYFTEEELLEFKHMSDEEFAEKVLRHFNTTDFKCPPDKFETVSCFYCQTCLKNARRLVKEKKKK